ncbi:MAG: MBL fold metallo-hydrolase [Firmicutes bacterium]|nr:MBL fold metallo-hydrolase [Bacillota bacterium]
MILKRLPAGIYAANCYIIGCNETKNAMIIDPAGDEEKIINTIKDLDLKVEGIILTHAHGDHIGALKKLKSYFNVPIMLHENDKYLLEDSNKNLSKQMSMEDVEITPDVLLKDKEKINIGKLKAEIIHTPGHTKGSISIKVDESVITGDTLFTGSIGRTDLLGGSFEEIIDSIKNKLMVLDDNIKVYPGHGPSSTIEKERKTNPFIK